MKEILIASVVLLVLIGVGIMRLLEKIRSLLEEIRENLPDKHFSSDPERGLTADEPFWREVQFTMNRIARIHGKFVLDEDILFESQKMREKWEQQRGRSDTEYLNDKNDP
jgi:hypothetical protein